MYAIDNRGDTLLYTYYTPYTLHLAPHQTIKQGFYCFAAPVKGTINLIPSL